MRHHIAHAPHESGIYAPLTGSVFPDSANATHDYELAFRVRSPTVRESRQVGIAYARASDTSLNRSSSSSPAQIGIRRNRNPNGSVVFIFQHMETDSSFAP